MCSGDKLVNTATSKLINLWRNCLIPSDVVSIIACVQPACLAWYKNCCSLNRPDIVIWYGFNHSFSLILNIRDEDTATFTPASSKTRESIKMELDLPFVPVTPTTIIDSDGKRYQSAATNASNK